MALMNNLAIRRLDSIRGSRGIRVSRRSHVIAMASLLFVASLAIPLAAQEKSNRRATAMYVDAAGFQNNAAYELAIEEWEKLLKEFPNDPLAGKAWHYLGVCHIQTEKPDYSKAIDAFSQALKNRKLEVREESLINLSWCLFNRAREAASNSPEQREGLEQAKQRLSEFLSEYGEGSYVDQALFYMGEIEYSLGNKKQSIAYYEKMLGSKALEKSGLRPDARYALAVAYEEQKDVARAERAYRAFLTEHANHRLANEVRVRLADLLLADNKLSDAEQLLTSSVEPKGDMADYALLRLGYVLSQQGKPEEASEKYLKLLRDFPDSPHAKTASLSVGQSLFGQGLYDQAVEQFQGALAAKDAQSTDAAHWIAVTLLRQNKAAEALEVVEDALSWSDGKEGSVQLKMDYADALYAIPNQLSKAQAAYELIAKEHPENALAPRATYNAAFAALQMGKFSDARKWSELFLEKFPKDPLRNDVAYVAAESLLQAGEHKAGAQAYSKLRSADPKNPAFPLWTLRLAMANYLSGDYQAAIELLRAEMPRMTQDSQKAEAHFILGASYLYEEQTATSIDQLKASLAASEQWNSADEVYLMLAEAYQRNKDNTNAKSTLETLLKKFPNTRLKAQVDYKLAQLSASMKQFREAISKYEAIVNNADAVSFHSFANYGIVWCLMQEEDYELALQRLGPLLRDGGNESIAADARLAEGICLRKLGRTDASVKSLEQFLQSTPVGMSRANALYEMGLAYTEQGEMKKANQQFLEIVEKFPNYPAMDKVLYELAWNCEETADSETAAKYFGRLAEEFPSSEFAAESMYMVAQQQYKAEQYEKAAATYVSVLERTRDKELLEKTQYKLGWSLFQQERYPQAAKCFAQQASDYPTGTLAVDASFMEAECAFKRDRFEEAFRGYENARNRLEKSTDSAASEQVKTLIYLHGAQCLREEKRWPECQRWLEVIVKNYPESPYIATTLYELGFAKQKQNKIEEALAHYSEVASNYRNEVAARSRFMMGEIYFEQRDFAKAIPEFQRVMYGFGGDKAPEDIRDWQVRSAFEAARCSEVLIEKLAGTSREKVVDTAKDFYKFVLEKHGEHDLAAQAQTRLGELQKLR